MTMMVIIDTAANAFNGNTLSLTTKLIDQLESEAKIIFTDKT